MTNTIPHFAANHKFFWKESYGCATLYRRIIKAREFGSGSQYLEFLGRNNVKWQRRIEL